MKCREDLKALGECCQLPVDRSALMNSTCKQAKGEDGNSEGKPSHSCYFECLFQTHGAIDEDGNLDFLKVKEIIEKSYQSSPELMSLAAVAIEKCFDKS